MKRKYYDYEIMKNYILNIKSFSQNAFVGQLQKKNIV